MNTIRRLREEESRLIEYLLVHLNLKPAHYPLPKEVEEYEGGVMGSIGLGKKEAVYKRDLVQMDYTDVDHVPVVITLTLDMDEQLLDLDFWKEDFSKLLVYPTPEKLQIRGF